MFPLGRYIAFGKDDFGKKELNCGEVKYLLQPIECGDKSETHTVREWFGDFDVSLEDTAFVHWNQAMSVIKMCIRDRHRGQQNGGAIPQHTMAEMSSYSKALT